MAKDHIECNAKIASLEESDTRNNGSKPKEIKVVVDAKDGFGEWFFEKAANVNSTSTIVTI